MLEELLSTKARLLNKVIQEIVDVEKSVLVALNQIEVEGTNDEKAKCQIALNNNHEIERSALNALRELLASQQIAFNKIFKDNMENQVYKKSEDNKIFIGPNEIADNEESLPTTHKVETKDIPSAIIVNENKIDNSSVNSNLNHHPQSPSNKHLLLVPHVEIMRINAKETVAVRLLGEKYSWLGEVTTNAKNKWLHGFISFFIAAPAFLVSTASLFSFVPIWCCCFIVIYTFYLSIINSLMAFNWTLLKLMFYKFETMFLIYNIIIFCTSMIYLFQDLRIIYYSFMLVTMCLAFLVDAFTHPTVRKSTGPVFAVLTIVAIFSAYLPLIFNWYNLPNLRDEVQIGLLHFAIGVIALSSMQNLVIFLGKLAFNGMRHPENMVILSCPLQLVSVKESDADVLLATNEIIKKK